MTTSIFNKIDLRIDGIPQEAIFQEKMQINSIAETLQKLEETRKTMVRLPIKKITFTPRNQLR